MPQSLSNVLVHIVFSTKGRQALLRDPGLRVEMHNYLGGISNQLDCPPVTIGGTDDHVHLLGRQARTICLADWIKELKRGSSLWIKTKDHHLAGFQWQAGYGAFSVSQSQCGRVESYIAGQEEHHRRSSFQEEFRRLLEKHNTKYDERYVWD
jgi:REP element-mobilizing transposase RayT